MRKNRVETVDELDVSPLAAAFGRYEYHHSIVCQSPCRLGLLARMTFDEITGVTELHCQCPPIFRFASESLALFIPAFNHDCSLRSQ